MSKEGDGNDSDDGGASAADNAGAEVVSAPEWLGEAHRGDFFDAETGQVNAEKMYAAYTDTAKKVSARDADLRRVLEPEIRSKIEADRLAARPDTVDGYTMDFPENFFPEGVTFEPDESNPLLAFWKEQCFEHGFTNEQYQKGVQQYVDGMINAMPNMSEVAKELGENGQDRIDAASLWLRRNLNSDEFSALSELVESRAGVEAVEKLISLKSDPKINNLVNTIRQSPKLTEQDLRGLISSDAYQDSLHPDHASVREKVEMGYQRLYDT